MKNGSMKLGSFPGVYKTSLLQFFFIISHKEKIRHYLVAMDFTAKKLTINGEKYYNNLPELVKVSPFDHDVTLLTCFTKNLSF